MAKYFENKQVNPIFTYGVIADTHMRPREGDESSPWEVNKYANDRARWVVDRVNRARPDFVIHMGDIVHPFPHLTTYGAAAQTALGICTDIKAPLYYIPGNHDVGDKKNPMMPAHAVDDFGLESYGKHFGPLHQSFDHKGIRFILINAQAFNSGLVHETAHARWLESDLKAHRGKRIHVFSHYPPYVLEPDEPSHYDNIDEPARSWFLGLLEQYEVEVLFAGHVHHFIYQKHGVIDCYNLPATSFVRQDYAEMFRIEAADEYGRNDAEKLGWCIVDVYENTHICRICRSGGKTLKEGEIPETDLPTIRNYHTRDRVISPLGVHLRHPWAETIDLPYNGPLDEFIRKRVRNDYTLLALWECGIRNLRVPLSDLLDETIRRRMQALVEMGHCFTVFSCGVPSGNRLEIIRQHRELVDFFEVILPWHSPETTISDLLAFRKDVMIPVYLANIESSADQTLHGSKFSHYVSYGFGITQTEKIDAYLACENAHDAQDGFVFRIGAEESPWDVIPHIGRYAEKEKFDAVANVRLASENPAEFFTDDIQVSNRVAEAMMAAAAARNVHVFLDTFVDLDRGYFPRVGLYDRRYNRRPGSFVFANILGVLNDYGPDISLGDAVEGPDGRTCVFESSRAAMSLFLPAAKRPHARTRAFWNQWVPERKDGTAKLADLVSGEISKVHWERNEREIILDSTGPCDVPSLFILEK